MINQPLAINLSITQLFSLISILILMNSNTHAQNPSIEVSTEADGKGDYGLCIGNDSIRGHIRYYYHEGDPSNNEDPYYFLALRGTEDTTKAGLFLTTDGIIIVGTEDPCYKGYEDSYRLFVEGNLFVEESAAKTDGSSFWTVINDPNLRTNQRTISRASDTFKQFNFYEYDGQSLGKYGIETQELQRLLPQSVQPLSNKEGALLTYNLNDLFFLHMKTTQELAASLEDLNQSLITAEKEQQALKTENEALKEELNTLQAQLNQISQTLEQNGMVIKQAVAEGNLSAPKTGNQKVSPNPDGSSNQRELLEDCQPNPLNQSTIIHYHIPPNTAIAKLTITNSNGQVLQSYPLNNMGAGQLIVDAQALRLSSGTYFYSLWLDGVQIATKQMILVE